MCHEAPCKEWHCRGQGGDHFLLEKAVKLLLVVFSGSKVLKSMRRLADFKHDETRFAAVHRV